MNRIDRDAACAESGIRSFNYADGRDISIGFTWEDQQLVALRNIHFAMHAIDGYGLRVLESCMGTVDLAYRSNVTVSVPFECQDCKGIERRHENFVVHVVISHVVNRSGKQRVLA